MKAVERIYQYIDIKELKKVDFERNCRISNGYLGKMYSRKADIGESILNQILEYCPDISPDWLLTGKEPMLRDKGTIKAEPTKAIKPIVGEKRIPLVSEYAVAGFGNANFAISEQDVKEYYVIPKFKYCKVDFMIEIHGSSMYPKYNSGDVVACTIIRESSFIQWNKCHLIATREQGLLVKRLKKGESPDTLLAVSDNKDYDPFLIPTSEIVGIALVIGVVRLE